MSSLVRARSAGFPLLLSPFLAGLLVAQDAAPEDASKAPQHVLQLSLDDAVRMALQQNLGLESEAITTDMARFDAMGSWGSFDPVLSATGTAENRKQEGQSQLSGGTVVKTDSLRLDSTLNLPLRTGGAVSLSLQHSNDDTTNTFSLFDTSTTDVVVVSLTQPLLRGAWSRYATTLQRQREVDLQRQQAREAQVRSQLVLDVYHAYWDLVSAIQLVSVRELALERARQQLEQDRRRLELGAGTEVDILQSETTVSQQEEQLLNAQFQQRQSEDNLRRMIFQEPSDEVEDFLQSWDWPIEPLTPLPKVTESSADWRRSLENAIEQRPELWQRRYEVDAAEVRLESARSDRMPQLDLNLSSSSGGFDPDPNQALSEAVAWDFPTNTASLDFSLPLRNRTARYAERSARAAVRQARLSLEQQELDILAEVRAAVRDLEYRTGALTAAEKSAALAQRQLEAEQVRMDIGLSTTFQVLQFQETLATSRAAEVTARAAYAKALVTLLHAEGRLDPELHAEE